MREWSRVEVRGGRCEGVEPWQVASVCTFVFASLSFLYVILTSSICPFIIQPPVRPNAHCACARTNE